MEKKRQEAMLHWLRQQKRDAQYKALVELEHHGSPVYIAKENEDAKMIEEIIEIVELYSILRFRDLTLKELIEALKTDPLSFGFTVIGKADTEELFQTMTRSGVIK